MILALSIGNTNLRFGFRRSAEDASKIAASEILDAASIPLEPWPPVLADIVGSRGVDRAILATVRPDLVAGIEKELSCVGISLEKIGVDFPVSLENAYEHPEELGVDRLLGVLAAQHRFPGEGVVVVDFGTALTFNVGSPDGQFMGGLIGIGASSAAAALPGKTPMLPRVELSSAPGFLARTTREAISAGISWEVIGGVERVLEGLRSELPFSFRCVATGGDAELLVPHTRGIETIVPDLVLEGLCVAWAAVETSI